MPIRNSSIGGTRKPSATLLSQRVLNRVIVGEAIASVPLRRHGSSALTQLVGLQAQTPNAPYLSLWSRPKGFNPDKLTGLILDRRVVRIALRPAPSIPSLAPIAWKSAHISIECWPAI